MSNFLPLGSVVMLKGGSQPLMIVAWATAQVVNGQDYYFDYAGVLYPQGLIGDKLAFFQNSGIDTVLFQGYRTVESERFGSLLDEYILEHQSEIVPGNPDEWNEGKPAVWDSSLNGGQSVE